jgi:hypothetical protein
MSTRAVNADRKGPKDLMDLANKANAYKAVLDAQDSLKAGTPERGALRPGGKAASVLGSVHTDILQNNLDDAFEHFSGLHGHDPVQIQATIDLLKSHIAKGKAH